MGDSDNRPTSALTLENNQYLESHPEMLQLTNKFIHAVRTQPSSNLLKFSASYFASLADGQELAPIVFAGPSGVGKGTLVNLLMTRYPELFGFSVSNTTRQPREGEVNGVHYHFVNIDDMEKAIARGEFVEYARVHTNMYGTSVESVRKVQSQSKICILDIDIQGVQKVKVSSLDCKFIFIAPPSMEELESRLRGRGTETEDKIQIRLKTASDEMAFGTAEGNFDAIIVNNDLEAAYEEIFSLLKKWYPRSFTH